MKKILILLLILLYCKEKIKTETKPTPISLPKLTLTYLKNGKVFRNQKLLSDETIKALESGDRIETDSNGTFEGKIGNLILFKLGKNSNAEIKISQDKLSIYLFTGKLLSLIQKEKKNFDFTVSTNQSESQARGTIFLASVISKNQPKKKCKDCVTKISVLEGSVKVQNTESKDELILEKKTEVNVEKDKELKTKKMNNKTLQDLKELMNIQKNEKVEFENLIKELEEIKKIIPNEKISETKLKKKSEKESLDVPAKIEEKKFLQKEFHLDKLKLEKDQDFNSNP